MVVIIMGVSCSGKSTIGNMLAEASKGKFYDGDDFHPAANIEKMKAGQALDDADRLPWLQRLRDLIIEEEQKPSPVFIACSALKLSYRHILDDNEHDVNLKFVYLKGSFELIQERMHARKGHFMPESLLRSQFDTLELPDSAIVTDISKPTEVVVADVLKKLKTARA